MELGETEVENLSVTAARDENVGGLDVAVNDVLGMGGVERVGDVSGEREEGVELQGHVCQYVFERLAVEEFHGDERMALVFANLINRADVGMVERGSGAGLAAKALERQKITRDIVGKEFEGDEAAELHVFGFVDDAHPAAT